MNKFIIAETSTFKKSIESKTNRLYYQRIQKLVYPALQANPFFGKNIKLLKGQFDGLFRFRIGNYRLFYSVNSTKRLVFILDFKHRKDAYR